MKRFLILILLLISKRTIKINISLRLLCSLMKHKLHCIQDEYNLKFITHKRTKDLSIYSQELLPNKKTEHTSLLL